MEINNLMQANLYSLRQAIGMATLQKAMNRDAMSVSVMLQDMQAATTKTMELSVAPHIGGNIDVSL